LLIVCACLLTTSIAVAAKGIVAKHSPQQPKSGEVVRINVTGATLGLHTNLSIEYQVVEPGHYIERSEPEYRRGWVSVPIQREGQSGSFAAELSASVQKHRRLVRYRIAAGGRVLAPGADDSQPNFAYFVYDGVPGWRAAVNPAKDAPVSFGAEVMRSVQVVHFIAGKKAVENVTWYERSDVFDESSRHRYAHTCTIVAGSNVYDHVRFRVRGGEWRHAMGKNMWKFDFPRGDHLQAHDDFGRPYGAKWEKLNLGACIQQGNYGRRGEHGLHEAVTYRLFNLAGVPAPRTHYVHLRIIDGVEESPTNQFQGDFWGLYLATEEIDDNFLVEHKLPDGNIYKWDFGQPKPEHFAKGSPTNRQDDVLQFVARYQRGQPEEWWRQNVDLARYFSYRAILECVHHYDIAFGKNYFYYFNPSARQWLVLPWDVDLTWKDTMFGTGQEPFFRAGVLRQPEFDIEYQNRLREVRDLLYNAEQTGALIDEFAAIISDPAGGPSFVDADRARWDYHPIMASRWVHPAKAGQGRFYAESPTRDFQGMVKLMKDYVVERGRWCDAALLKNDGLPPTPTLTAQEPFDLTKPELLVRATLGAKGVGAEKTEWRVAEITLGAVTRSTSPRKYEIEPIWQQTGEAQMKMPSKFFEPGRTYRIRARFRDSSGRCGHWSPPFQFTAGKSP
jgi:hypothetical protein